MSPKVNEARQYIPDTVKPLSADKIIKARKIVASNSKSIEDCEKLLDILGILKD